MAAQFIALESLALAASLRMRPVQPPSSVPCVPGAGGPPGLSPELSVALPPIVEFVVREDVQDIVSALENALTSNPGCDIVLLGDDAVLPENWLPRLAKAAVDAPRTGAVAPLCDAHPVSSLLTSADGSMDEARVGLIDRLAYWLGERRYYEMPTLHAVCTYFRHDALKETLGTLDARPRSLQEVVHDLADALRNNGWNCVLCDYVYVGSSCRHPAGVAESLATTAYIADHPLGMLRLAVADALEQGYRPPLRMPGLDPVPVRLHVMHFWGGGVDKWVRDFARADDQINLLFTSYRIGDAGGQRLALYSDPDAGFPLRTWDLARPIPSVSAGSIEYGRVIRQIVEEYSVDAVIVSSLIGHALEALDLPVPTIIVLHDYLPVCQAINPYFRSPCTQCTLTDLRACRMENPLNQFFDDLDETGWDALRRRFAHLVRTRNVTLVAPSASVSRTIRLLAPSLGDVPIRIIPHGLDMVGKKLQWNPPGAGEKLRLVVLGRLKPHKGVELLRAAAPELSQWAEVTLLGCGEEGMALAGETGWKGLERYDPDELPALLAALAPHAGLLASAVPETFSYTLSELFALGIPPLATRLGSFEDRIEDGSTGFLFDPDPTALVDGVRRLSEAPELLRAVAQRLAAQGAIRSTKLMAADYAALLPDSVPGVARFKVCIGTQTGLTAPYQRLDVAYQSLRLAYDQLLGAYEDTRQAYASTASVNADLQAAYETARSDLGRVTAEVELARAGFRRSTAIIREWDQAIGLLDLRHKWWNVLPAVRLTQEMRNNIRGLALGESDPCAKPMKDPDVPND